jgi:hypothetical protein
MDALMQVNGTTFPAEKMHHDTLDALVEAMRTHVKVCGTVPAIFKVDIDSAFRRVPIRPSDRWAAGVAFKVGREVWVCYAFAFCTHEVLCEVYVSRHAACPFGEVSGKCLGLKPKILKSDRGRLWAHQKRI